MEDHDLYELDFREFVRQGIIECFGDHPGNGMEEAMRKVDEMEYWPMAAGE